MCFCDGFNKNSQVALSALPLLFLPAVSLPGAPEVKIREGGGCGVFPELWGLLVGLESELRAA